MMGERWRRKKNAWGLSISRTHLYLSEIDSKGNMQQRRYLKGGGESILSLLSSSLKTLQLVTFLAKGICSFWFCI